MTKREKIFAVIMKWGEVASAAGLAPNEAIDAAGEWLALLIMNAGWTEQQAHEVLNSAIESGHIFINENWREAQLAQKLERESR